MNSTKITNPLINILNSKDSTFYEELKTLLSFDPKTSKVVFDKVEKILSSVKNRGDDALLEYSKLFDNYEVVNSID